MPLYVHQIVISSVIMLTFVSFFEVPFNICHSAAVADYATTANNTTGYVTMMGG